jgi:amicyanin
MKSKAPLVLGLVIIIVAVIVVVLIAGHKSSTTNSTAANQSMADMDMSGNNGSSDSNSSDNATATDSVNIDNFAFSPAKITVKVGTTVTWTNKDSVTHTVTSDDGSAAAFDSGNLESGKTYQFTFQKAGTYTYHCNIHPDMQGTIVVTEE